MRARSTALTALVAGVAMVALAWRIWTRASGERAGAAAKRLFAFSILYLFILFAVLLVEAGFRAGGVR